MNGAPPANNNSYSNQKKMYGQNMTNNKNFYNEKGPRFTRSGKKGKGHWGNQNNFYNNNYGGNSNNYSNSKNNNYHDRNYQQNHDNNLNPNQLQRPLNNKNFGGYNKESSGEKINGFYPTNPSFPNNNMDNLNNDQNLQRNYSNKSNDLLANLNLQNNQNDSFSNTVGENEQVLVNNQQSGLVNNELNNSFNNIKIEKTSDVKSNTNEIDLIQNELNQNDITHENNHPNDNSQLIILQNNEQQLQKDQNQLEVEKIKEMISNKPNLINRIDAMPVSKAKPIAKQRNYALPEIPLDFNEFDTDYEDNVTDESLIFMGLFRAFDLMNPEFFNGEDNDWPQENDANQNNVYGGYEENFNGMNDFGVNQMSGFNNDFLNMNTGIDYNFGAANYMGCANEMANMFNNMSENQNPMDLNQIQNNMEMGGQYGACNPFLGMMNTNANQNGNQNQTNNNMMHRNQVQNKDMGSMNNNFDMNFGLNMMNAMSFNNNNKTQTSIPNNTNDNTFNNMNFNNNNFLMNMNFNDINTNWNKLLNNNGGNNINEQKPKISMGKSKKSKKDSLGLENNEIIES